MKTLLFIAAARGLLAGALLGSASAALANDASIRELDVYCLAADGTRGGVAASQDGATLVYTQQPNAAEDALHFVHSRSVVAQWHAQLDAAGFDGLATVEPAGDFCAIKRTQAGHVHQIAWPRDAAPPAPLGALFEAIMNFRYE
ncbi:hypothetical protein [Devosia sp. A449]